MTPAEAWAQGIPALAPLPWRPTGVCRWCEKPVAPPARNWHPDCLAEYQRARIHLRAEPDYPAEWPVVAVIVKCLAGWRCQVCLHPHAPRVGRVLTVHHLDGDKRNLRDWNLLAACQRCHLRIQATLDFRHAVLVDQLSLLERPLWLDWRIQRARQERAYGYVA